MELSHQHCLCTHLSNTQRCSKALWSVSLGPKLMLFINFVYSRQSHDHHHHPGGPYMLRFRFTNEAQVGQYIISLARIWNWSSEMPQIPTDDLVSGHVDTDDATLSSSAMNTESREKMSEEK